MWRGGSGRAGVKVLRNSKWSAYLRPGSSRGRRRSVPEPSFTKTQARFPLSPASGPSLPTRLRGATFSAKKRMSTPHPSDVAFCQSRSIGSRRQMSAPWVGRPASLGRCSSAHDEAPQFGITPVSAACPANRVGKLLACHFPIFAGHKNLQFRVLRLLRIARGPLLRRMAKPGLGEAVVDQLEQLV